MEKQSYNRLGGSKSLYTGYQSAHSLNDYQGVAGLELGGNGRLDDSKKSFPGYTTNYRPQDPTKGVKPYDSIWELFKQ